MKSNLPRVKKGMGSGLSGLERKARQVVLGVALTVGAGLTGGAAGDVQASVARSESQMAAVDQGAVLLAPSELSESAGTVTIAYHQSHRSHYSHQSHRSHYSHYSGY
jgi:hypothetical protein